MFVSTGHVVQSSLGDNYDNIALTLSSTLAKGPALAQIMNNANPDYVSWVDQVRNGTSIYTEVNGNVTINNVIRVGSNELKVQRNGTHLTVDFNPAKPVAITLPAALFPAANFSSAWTVPAFHMDFYGTTALAIVPNSTTLYPSGWTFYQDGAGYNANVTFSCPSWNNYSTTGSGGTVAEFVSNRNVPPVQGPIPSNPTKTIEAYTGTGLATVDIPKTGGINQISINAGHVEQGTMGTYDLLLVTFTATSINASVEALFITSQRPEIPAWIQKYSVGDLIAGNIIQVSANELRVQRNGTHLAVDFNPATPKSINLPASVFPPATFPATWTIPAFHADFDAVGSTLVITGFTELFRSGWSQAVTAVARPANAAFTFPSWNYTAAGTSTRILPYMIRTTKSPDAPDVSAFCNVTVPRGWTWWFFAQGTGVGPLTYQWYEGTTPLQGQTSMVLPITKTTTGVYTYYCTVTDPNGNTAISNTVTLTVLG
jgi:hypothetical protein